MSQRSSRGWLGVVIAAVLALGVTAVFLVSPERAAPDAVSSTTAESRGHADVARVSSRSGVASRPASVAGLGRFRASILDADGVAVGGGSVALSCLSEDGQVGPIAGGAQRLGEDGTFEAPACPGLVCIEYRHATHVRGAPWTARRGEDLAFEARPLARLWGEVHDEAGEQVPNASVSIAVVSDTGGLPVVTPHTSTDVDGVFSVGKVAIPPCDPCQATLGCHEARPLARRVVLSARREGYGPVSVQVELGARADGAAAEDPWILVLPAASVPIGGVLTDAAGQPLPRAFVLARSLERPAERHRADVDADNGEFLLKDLGPGAYSLRVVQDGVEVITVEEVTAGQRLTLTPVAPAQPRDLIVEIVADGEPLPDVSVRGGPFVRAMTDSSGQVRAESVLPRTYILRVDGRAAGHDSAHGRVTVVLRPSGQQSREPARIVVDAGTLKRG
ncbi:MAG: carboxypeptidase regulatory-like domain-containing protein [Nannocystaceae bacterium]|nr:carboxypeptidase regulatory-like domain-containing protein [Nannocystaceae bacterium]